jgi:ubiquinone/menaquinone biosynthesis C-methylase UbiE
MSKNTGFESPRFDHNAGWKSRAVAEAYDGRRFASFGGKLYDGMEKRAIVECLDVAEKIAPFEAVLDLACGTGRISELLAKRGYRLTCGDISDEMLRVAQKRLASAGFEDVRFMKADIYKIEQPTASFDCVTAFRLFQHLTSEQRARALHEMARVSRRFVLVNVMHTSTYYGAVRRLRQALGRYTTRYTSTQAETDQEIGHAGLRIVKSLFTQPAFNGNRVLLLEKTP